MSATMEVDTRVETKVDHNYHQLPGEKTERWETVLPPEYFEYRRRWNENPVDDVVEPFPVHLDIEATSNCNLKCSMCPRTEMVANGTFWRVKSFDFDLYCRLIDEGAEKGLASIKFNYLGEPLMNPRLVEMIRYAKDRGVVDVMFNTNATMLTERLARELVESGLDKLFFSVDSPDREHYNEIRVNADYDKVMRNIRRFMEIRREMNSLKPFTRVAMVRMKENEHEWQAFRDLFEPIVDAVGYQDYMDHSSQSKTDKGVIEVKATKETKFCCPQLWQRMFVHPDGVVSVCCVDSARVLSVGNIHNRTVEEIWTGSEYEKLRELHRTGRIDEISVCSKCPLALSA